MAVALHIVAASNDRELVLVIYNGAEECNV